MPDAMPATPTVPATDADSQALAAELARASGGAPPPLDPSDPFAPAADPVPPDAPAPEADEASEPSTDAPAEPEPVFDVEVPLPNGDGENGPVNAGRLKLALPTQEAADALRFHLKRSQAVGKAEAKLETYQEDHATVDFLRANPLEGMLWMAQARPEAGTQYVQHWMRANPMDAVQTLQAMGFQVDYGEANERTLRAEAALAKMEAQQRLQQGQGQFQQTAVQARFQSTASEVVTELVGELGYTPTDPRYPLVTAALAEQLARLYDTTRGTATRAQMLLHTQPLVREEMAYRQQQQTHRALRVTQAAEQPRDPSGQFAAKAALADKMAKAQPGGTTVVTPLAAVKAKPGQTWDEVMRELSRGPTRAAGA